MSGKARPAKRKVRHKGSGRGVTPRKDTVVSSGSGARYTPPSDQAVPRFRPQWHKVAGAAVVPAGFALFVVCRFNVENIHAYGGHIWYLLAFAIAASSVWWWGAFDPRGSGFRA